MYDEVAFGEGVLLRLFGVDIVVDIEKVVALVDELVFLGMFGIGGF